MTPSTTTRAPITPLKPTHQRVAQHLVDGHTAQDITTRTGLSPHTVRQYVRDIRVSVHCPPRCKPQVLVHLLLAAEQVAPPAPERPAPELNSEQQLLLKAVAELSSPRDIALAAKIAPADLRSALANCSTRRAPPTSPSSSFWPTPGAYWAPSRPARWRAEQ
ncbi:helix-turn-helix transcriptional regulator [Streptomyces finlayi]|uniref:helix-turn-helix transcriptional regulator n=1 Tax=Streptomyces finlayi TaxID=67296 RepID=UPI00215612FA|nr:DNA-binding protein [Streptomyces finlayi]